ncbi:hypothetical protein OPT61_g4218 [Boeremia exigua]|uniref:Uncharacterized protein n=1 Tax=Boeremia exigua TaxID=749465 RepID=A0ACC2IF02_9PLEO|nr:hypothetical protein OPT61_g4218 [Boeremia exigua]
MASYNPFAFTPRPVNFFATSVYIALFAALLLVHVRVPSYPSRSPRGTNLTEAWNDLQHITRQFHPYNSHANDHVRDYLMARIDRVVRTKNLSKHHVQVIDDNVSNATFSSSNTTVYFEGTNLIVAIRGSEDDEPFYSPNQSALATQRRPNNGGVLVNAHYDSVSSGYGATDDGVGVVCVLQLLSYFTEAENWPKRTLVLLLNNGEEDFLNGAKAFMRHPISQVPHTFLNLEGAGAGGRATLFRSTDTEVTKYYRASKHPFGTVVSADGFKKGLIRSETDYKVFYGELGLRGLDIAFMEPRARYHTIEDSTRETSLKSVWHMLSASIATVSGLASDTSDQFNGAEEHLDGKVDAGIGTDAVWFDLLGQVFVVFRLHTFFALCVTLLVVAPLTLIGLTFGLSRADKNYLFARKTYVHSPDDDEPVYLHGWKGFFRLPIVFVIATAAVVGLAYLVVRVNPLIVYSSPYAVWSMMISAWISFAWFFSRGASAMRPSALQRIYGLIWLFVGSFVLLAFVTVLANNYQLAGGYWALFYYAAVFAALLLSYLELFFAPRKSAYAQTFDLIEDDAQPASRPLTGNSLSRSDDRSPDDEATETTSLLRGDQRSFARTRHGSRRGSSAEDEPRPLDLGHPYPGEQEWSGKLPSWIWIVQFLLLVPITVIMVGQIALLLTSALYQTPSDGNSSLFIYLSFAVLTTLLIAPAGPFAHRITYHIPTFLFLVCVGTVIYNLVAFPFSREHRLKVYFVQQVNLETGVNTVSLTGVDGYVQQIIDQLPSAQGKIVYCSTPDVVTRKELKKCEWEGLPAEVVANASSFTHKSHFDNWLDYTIKKGNNTGEATIRVSGQNTRACRVLFDTSIRDLSVAGGVSDPRFRRTGEHGSREVRLWHREWSQPWNVSVSWDVEENSKLTGRVVCLWSDANTGGIPAFDEILVYNPGFADFSSLRYDHRPSADYVATAFYAWQCFVQRFQTSVCSLIDHAAKTIFRIGKQTPEIRPLFIALADRLKTRSRHQLEHPWIARISGPPVLTVFGLSAFLLLTRRYTGSWAARYRKTTASILHLVSVASFVVQGVRSSDWLVAALVMVSFDVFQRALDGDAIANNESYHQISAPSSAVETLLDQAHSLLVESQIVDLPRRSVFLSQTGDPTAIIGPHDSKDREIVRLQWSLTDLQTAIKAKDAELGAARLELLNVKDALTKSFADILVLRDDMRIMKQTLGKDHQSVVYRKDIELFALRKGDEQRERHIQEKDTQYNETFKQQRATLELKEAQLVVLKERLAAMERQASPKFGQDTRFEENNNGDHALEVRLLRVKKGRQSLSGSEDDKDAMIEQLRRELAIASRSAEDVVNQQAELQRAWDISKKIQSALKEERERHEQTKLFLREASAELEDTHIGRKRSRSDPSGRLPTIEENDQNELEAMFDTAQQDNLRLHMEIETLDKRVRDANARIFQADQEIEALREQVRLEHAINEDMETARPSVVHRVHFQRMEGQLKESREEQAKKEAELQRLRTTLQQRDRQLDNLQADMDAALKNSELLHHEVKQLKQSIVDLGAAKERLIRDHERLATQHSGHRVSSAEFISARTSGATLINEHSPPPRLTPSDDVRPVSVTPMLGSPTLNGARSKHATRGHRRNQSDSQARNLVDAGTESNMGYVKRRSGLGLRDMMKRIVKKDTSIDSVLHSPSVPDSKWNETPDVLDINPGPKSVQPSLRNRSQSLSSHPPTPQKKYDPIPRPIPRPISGPIGLGVRPRTSTAPIASVPRRFPSRKELDEQHLLRPRTATEPNLGAQTAALPRAIRPQNPRKSSQPRYYTSPGAIAIDSKEDLRLHGAGLPAAGKVKDPVQQAKHDSGIGAISDGEKSKLSRLSWGNATDDLYTRAQLTRYEYDKCQQHATKHAGTHKGPVAQFA